MKRIIGFIALGLSTLAMAHHDDCNLPAVNAYAARLSNAAIVFARQAAATYGYSQLSADADGVSREAQRISYAAQTGASCEVLDGDFDYLDRYYRPLATGYQSAQAYYPNAYMGQLWFSVDSEERNLWSSLHVAPPPPPPITTAVTVDCGSSKYQYRFCPVAGRVAGAQLMQVLSHASCVLGRSYGFLPNGVWVNRGCHGIFLVQVQP